jgi:hypothetical protein
MNPITLTKKFHANLVEEYSSVPTVTPLGRHECEMTLYAFHPGKANHIVWNYSLGGEQDETGIGLDLDGMKVTGYDGVFSLPAEAIALLKEAGFDTTDVDDTLEG